MVGEDCAALIVWPTSTGRPTTVPSIGAVISVRLRLSSAFSTFQLCGRDLGIDHLDLRIGGLIGQSRSLIIRIRHQILRIELFGAIRCQLGRGGIGLLYAHLRLDVLKCRLGDLDGILLVERVDLGDQVALLDGLTKFDM